MSRFPRSWSCSSAGWYPSPSPARIGSDLVSRPPFTSQNSICVPFSPLRTCQAISDACLYVIQRGSPYPRRRPVAMRWMALPPRYALPVVGQGSIGRIPWFLPRGDAVLEHVDDAIGYFLPEIPSGRPGWLGDRHSLWIRWRCHGLQLSSRAG